jgi:hypothetical protein
MFKCPTCSKQLQRTGKLYQCPGCSQKFSQFEVCFGTKPPPALPPSGRDDDRLQPSRVPKKPYPPPDAATSSELALPKRPEAIEP